MKTKKEKKVNKVIRSGIDTPFFVLVVILLAFGLVMMFSASFASAYYQYGDSFYYVRTQMIAAGAGIAAMIFLSTWDYKFWRKFALPLFATSLVLLVLVLIIGREINGSTRWIFIGPINFQPSEIMKL